MATRSFALTMLCAATAFGQVSNTIKLIKDCEIDGPSYKSVTASVQECADHCRRDKMCASFQVSSKPGSGGVLTCEFKNKIGIQFLGQRGSTCGVKPLKDLLAGDPAGDGGSDGNRTPSEGTHSAIALREGIPPEVAEQLKERIGRSQAGATEAGPAVRPVAPPAPKGPPQLAGNWSTAADSGKIVRITQSGNDITFHDSAGLTAPAKLADGKLIVESWKVEAQMVESGKKLQWSNGQVWTRVE